MGDSVANNMSLKNGRTFWGEIMKLVRSFTHLYDVISQDKKVSYRTAGRSDGGKGKLEICAGPIWSWMAPSIGCNVADVKTRSSRASVQTKVVSEQTVWHYNILHRVIINLCAEMIYREITDLSVNMMKKLCFVQQLSAMTFNRSDSQH